MMDREKPRALNAVDSTLSEIEDPVSDLGSLKGIVCGYSGKILRFSVKGPVYNYSTLSPLLPFFSGIYPDYMENPEILDCQDYALRPLKVYGKFFSDELLVLFSGWACSLECGASGKCSEIYKGYFELKTRTDALYARLSGLLDCLDSLSTPIVTYNSRIESCRKRVLRLTEDYYRKLKLLAATLLDDLREEHDLCFNGDSIIQASGFVSGTVLEGKTVAEGLQSALVLADEALNYISLQK